VGYLCYGKVIELKIQQKLIYTMKKSLIKFITEMDFVKDMIENVRSQSEAFHNIAASSEEMAVATEDIANFVNSVVAATNKLIYALQTT